MGKMKELQIARDNGYNAAFVLKTGQITYGNFSTDASIRRWARFVEARVAVRLSGEGGDWCEVVVYQAGTLSEKLRKLWGSCCRFS